MVVWLLSIWSWWLPIVMMRTSKYCTKAEVARFVETLSTDVFFLLLLIRVAFHFISEAFLLYSFTTARNRLQYALIEQIPNYMVVFLVRSKLNVNAPFFCLQLRCCVLSWFGCCKTTNFLLNLMFRNDVVNNEIEFNRKSFSRHLNTHGLIPICDEQKPVYIYLIVYLCKFLV